MIEIKEKLLKMADDLPAYPQSVRMMVELASDIDCAPKDLVNVIEHDPVMTAKFLRLLNSDYFARGIDKKIYSTNQAVVRLGVNTVKNIALDIASIGALPVKSKDGIHMRSILEHALGVAIVSRRVAETLELSAEKKAIFFVAGLLHDFGKLIFAYFMPHACSQAWYRAKSQQKKLTEIEHLLIGIDHAELGYAIAKRWRLPKALRVIIRDHHKPNIAIEPDHPQYLWYRQLHDVVTASNHYCKTVNIGQSGNPDPTPLPKPVQERLAEAMPISERISAQEVLREIHSALIFAI
ncbi:HDOD domain-containing protein [Magnetococcales bacterium HHB-1]